MKKTQGETAPLGTARRTFKTIALGAAAALILPMLGSAWVAPSAHASGATSNPGQPQNPQAPTVAYAENFQNVATGGTPEPLTSYTAGGQTYTADASWLPGARLCNGWILNYVDPVAGSGNDRGCSTDGGATGMTSGTHQDDTAWFFLQQMANQLGVAELNAAGGNSLTGSATGVDPNAVASAKLAGITTASQNNAVSSQTNPGSGSIPQAAGVQVQTTGSPITAIPGHYYAVSAWFAEAHCHGDGAKTSLNNLWAGTNAKERLSLIVNGDTTHPVILEQNYNPCLGDKVIGAYNTPIRVSFIQSSAVLLTTASSLGLQLYNANGGTTGNDVAFDLPEIMDVTPQIDKTFGTVAAPVTTAEAGVPVPLTITITNTTELAAKDGWSFTDKLDPSLSVVPGSTTTDCNDAAATPPNGTVAVVPNADGSTSLKVTGNLADGQAYCTVSAMVVSDRAGEFTNDSTNLSATVGVDLPGPAIIDVTAPTLNLDKTITSVTPGAVTISPDGKSASGLTAGDKVTYAYQVTNTSAVPLDDVWVIEPDQPGTTPATEYPFNGTLANGKAPTEAHAGYVTAAELGASFNGSGSTPTVGNCTYDQGGSSVANGLIKLDPGKSATCTGTYTVTQDDVNAYSKGTLGVINTSVAIGTNLDTESDPTSQQSASDTSTATITFNTTHGLSLVKSATSNGSLTALVAGNRVTYSFLMTNTGTLTLTNVSVKDSGNYTDDTTVGFSGSGTLGAIGNCRLTSTGLAVAYPVPTIQPGDSATCTAAYTVMQADVDAGHLDNVADATGTTPDSHTETSNLSPKHLPASTVASLQVTKTASVNGTSTTAGGAVTAAGQVVTFTVTAKNTGDVTLHNVSVTDDGLTIPPSTPIPGSLTLICPAAAGWPSGVVGTLAPGESVACTTSYQATQADVDTGETLTNHATAAGKDPSDKDVSGKATVDVPVQPAAGQLTLVKTADKSAPLVFGDAIYYSFLVINSGGLTVNSISIYDWKFSGSPALTISCPVTTLAPGQRTTCTADPYTVTLADVNSGDLSNIAKAIGTDSQNNPVTSNDSNWDVTQVPANALQVTKDANPLTVDRVGQIAYTITAVNKGNVTLTGVKVTDSGVTNGAGVTTPVSVGDCDLNGNSAATLDNVAGFTLDPGDVAICTASYTATQDDIDAGHTLINTASASGKDPTNATVDSNQPSVSVDVTSSDSLLLTKTPASQTVTAAGDVTWTVTATNDGTSALTGVKIVDPSMSNGSAVTLSGCVVGATPVDNDLGFTLPKGASAICTATYAVTADDMAAATQLSNTANASGVNPNAQPVVATPATATVDFAGLQVTKTPATTTVSAVGDVTWTVAATNTGSVPLTDVTVADPQMSNGGAVSLVGCQIGATSVNNQVGFTLAPQETVTCLATYAVTQADLDAGTLLTNIANATGTTPTGLTIQSNDATATVAITQSPALTLLKTADVTNVLTVSHKVNYSFLVTNTGNVTVKSISIDDSVFSGSPAISNITCPATTLAPGESTTCTADPYTVTQDDVNAGDLSNTATANGTTPDGTPVPSNPDTWSIPQTPSASVGITETPSKASGLTANYQLTFFGTATNTGNVPLTNVTLANLAAGWTGSGPMPAIDLTSLKVNGVAVTNGAFTLIPGQQVTYTTLPYTVLQQDVDNNTPLANEVSVIGNPPVASRLAQVSDETTVSATMVTAYAHIAITETASQPSGLKAGDKVTFTSVATNDGNVTLHDVYLTDDPAGWTGAGPMPTLTTFMVKGVPVINGSFSLAPGEKVVTVTTPYTVLPADVSAAKPISNRVVVRGTPPVGLNLPEVTAMANAPVTTIPAGAPAPSGPPSSATGGATTPGGAAWLLLILLGAVPVVLMTLWRRRVA